MRKIPVETGGLRFEVANPVSAVVDFDVDGRPQRKDESGVPLWQVGVLFRGAGDTSVAKVKFAAQTEPSLAMEAPLTIEGLVATPYVSGNRAALSFSAASVKAASTASAKAA